MFRMQKKIQAASEFQTVQVCTFKVFGFVDAGLVEALLTKRCSLAFLLYCQVLLKAFSLVQMNYHNYTFQLKVHGVQKKST